MRRLPLITLLLPSLLTGCGGAELTPGPVAEETGLLDLAVTDAPVDYATAVVVRFLGVELVAEDGRIIRFDLDPPRQIDLLALQGLDRALLLDDAVVPAGRYEGLRLLVEATETGQASFVELRDGGLAALVVPAGDSAGLVMATDFRVEAGEEIDLTLDFQLRRGLVEHLPGQEYRLLPALRLVETDTAGAVTGTVDNRLVLAVGCENGALSDLGNSVYVYEGFNRQPEDVWGTAVGPLTSAAVRLDPFEGEYRYSVGFLPAGAYTVAFTCQAALDQADADDLLVFHPLENVVVPAGGVIEQNLAP